MASTLKVTGPTLQTGVSKTTSQTSSTSPTVVTGSIINSLHYKRTLCTPTEKYHYLVKRGLLVPYQPFSQFDITIERSDWRRFRTTNNTTGAWSQVIYENVFTLPDTTPDHLVYTAQAFEGIDLESNRLANEAAAKIMTSGWDVLTFTAELHKTREMFASVATKLAGLKARFLRLDKSKWLAKDVNTAFSLWLEGRYGWRTLIYDLEDLARAANKAGKPLSDRQFRFANDTFEDNDVQVMESNPYSNIHLVTTTTIDRSVKTNGHVAAEKVSSVLNINPVATAWELVRFSFVIDWVINVGQAIQVGTFLLTTDKYTASVGAYAELTKHVRDEFTPIQTIPGSTWLVEGYIDTLYTVKTGIRRPTKLTAVPQFELRLNTFKVIDLIGLMLKNLT